MVAARTRRGTIRRSDRRRDGALENHEAYDPPRIGPYSLTGGTRTVGDGDVFAGRSDDGQVVSVTVVHPEVAAVPGFRERFRTGVEAARAVSGDFILPVLGADPDAASPWSATALVPGLPLRQAVERHSPLPEPALRQLAGGLATAMARIHAAGLIHHDVGPDSVLLAVDGPYLAAFSLTGVSEPVGSPMNDMFDLGTTVLFAASGKEPHWAGAAEHMPTLLAELEAVTSVLPSSLREVIGGCLYPDPSTRPTAQQFIDYLDRWGSMVPARDWLPPTLAIDIKALAPAATLRTVGVSRRNLIFGLAGGALLIGGATAAVAAWRSPVDPPAGSAPPARPTSQSSTGESATIVLDAPDTTKAWTAVGQTPPRFLAASDKVVMLVTEKSTAFLDASTGKGVLPALNTTSAFGSASSDIRATYAAGVFYYLCEAPEADNLVVAVDGTTGKVKWATSMALFDSSGGGTWSYSATYVAVQGNTVYVCGGVNDLSSVDLETTVGYIRAFDGMTGKRLWQVEGTDINNVLVPPSGPYLLAASSTPSGRVGQVQMIDAGKQGARGWKTPIQDASFFFQTGWPVTCHAAGMFFFAGGAGGTLLAVDAANGTEKWHQDFAAKDEDQVQIGNPFVSLDGATVYVSVGGDLAAFGSADGTLKWMAKLTGASTMGPPNTFNASLRLNNGSAQCSADTVFITDAAKTLWAIDAATGRARWKYNDPGQPDVGFRWTVGGDYVFIASNLTMTAIAAH